MLTVLTTSMGAGTYAKFVSRVSASGGSKSAGFLITSTNSTSEVDLTASTLIAPSQTKNIDITFSYYSQVLTQFKSNTNDVTVTGTGALEGNFYTLLDEYNSTWLPLHKDSYADNNKKAPSNLGEMFSLSFNGYSSIAEACVMAVRQASGNKLAVTGTVVEAMPSNATQSLSCSITATLTWEEVSDAWDTFIGNKVYEYMQSNIGKHTGITVNIGVTAEQCFSVVEEGTTNIPNGYFQGRKDLREVTIPEGVTSIGANSFSGCTNLEKVEIPEGVTTIGNGAFQNCTSLKEVTIPTTVKTINNNTFQGCTSLEKINVPNGVESIGIGAFYGCTSLNDVNLPEGVTTIESSAFEGCNSLTEIEIPSTLTTLNTYAFRNATGLTKVTLSSDAISQIGADIFAGSTTIEYNQDGNGYYLGNEDNPYIMLVKSINSTITSLDINPNCKLIAGYALCDCAHLTKLTIPEGVVTIGIFICSGCSNLTDVKLPSTLANINSKPFELCSSLTNISFDNGNPKFGSSGSCIYEKASKTLIVAAGINPLIPDDGSVEIIATNSIHTCCDTITIPKTIKVIRPAAFLSCLNLQELLVTPENPNYYVSGNCLIERSSGTMIVGVGNFTIPDDGSVKRILGYAVYSNRAITSVVIPEGVERIDNEAIAHCGNLTEITIPRSVTRIDSNAFVGCGKLETIRFTGTPEEWAAKSYSSLEVFKGKNIIFNS